MKFDDNDDENFENDDKNENFDFDDNDDENFDDNNDDDENLENDDKNKNYDGDDENENSDNNYSYSPSSPLYDEDSKDRFEKLKFLLKLQNQNNPNLSNDTDENYLNDDDEITADEIRAQLNDIFNTSDEDI